MNQKSNIVNIESSRKRNSDRQFARPTDRQRMWLECGLNQPGGKLPLFDHNGQRINERTIRSCIENGWAEHWFNNPTNPDWLICKLTSSGRALFKN